MKFTKRTLAATLAASSALGAAGPAWADGGGVAAGLFAGMLVSRAAQANRQSAYQSGYNAGSYSQPQTVVVQQPAPSGGGKSAESRIAELNDMHQKGLITDNEYASRKKAILDSL